MYRQLPEDMEEVNDKLHYAIWFIENEVMEKMWANSLKWKRACIILDGRHFEQLL